MENKLDLIGGQWVEARSGEQMEVCDPATDEPIATVPRGGKEDARAAIEAAHDALPGWRDTTADERGELLHRLAQAMTDRADALAELMTREQGKPREESRGEIAYAASFLDWAAEEGKRLRGEVVPASSTHKRVLVLRQPVGVTAAITPWNFPSAMITRKLGPALAAGCTMVVKPASQTPLSALALGELAMEVGIPAGVVNVITGSSEEIGDELLGNPTVRKLSFTGSTPVGKTLIRKSADTVTRLSLELGGHAPFIVFDDADLDVAVKAAKQSKFRNMGQTCICPNRFFVHQAVYEAFARKLEAALSDARLGRGLDEGVTMGPLIDDDAVAKVQEHLADAKARGARLRCGGTVLRPAPELTERFFEPTILDDVDATMAMSQEETFGPVVGLQRFESEQDVIARANDTPYGLASYFFTRDGARVWRVAEALEYGIVGVNDGAPSDARAPFGGMKESGYGREGGHWVMDEYTEIKYVSWGQGAG